MTSLQTKSTDKSSVTEGFATNTGIIAVVEALRTLWKKNLAERSYFRNGQPPSPLTQLQLEIYIPKCGNNCEFKERWVSNILSLLLSPFFPGEPKWQPAPLNATYTLSTRLTQVSLGSVSQKFMAIEPLQSPALCEQPLKRERSGRPIIQENFSYAWCPWGRTISPWRHQILTVHSGRAASCIVLKLWRVSRLTIYCRRYPIHDHS